LTVQKRALILYVLALLIKPKQYLINYSKNSNLCPMIKTADVG
jgi:hypothetical protein